jgi:hypothetical protein
LYFHLKSFFSDPLSLAALIFNGNGLGGGQSCDIMTTVDPADIRESTEVVTRP